MSEKELCKIAVAAAENAYSPYSGCSVGAALLTANGNIYTGCNIENASFTPTVCAERVAVFKAVSSGEKSFTMLAVAGSKNGCITGAFPPCGVCRQVISEFCAPDFPVLIVKNGEYDFDKYTLEQLLPLSFTLDNRR